MDKQLENKNILVTGASRGIGKAIAEFLLSKKAIEMLEGESTIRSYRAAYLLNLTTGCNYKEENFFFVDGLEYLENTNRDEWPGYLYIFVSFGEWKKLMAASPDWLDDYEVKNGELMLLSLVQ